MTRPGGTAENRATCFLRSLPQLHAEGQPADLAGQPGCITLSAMALTGPAPVSHNPLSIMLGDWRAERAATVPFPPGDTRPSLRRTDRFARDPLPLLLEAYERYGPVFTLRIFHGNVVFMLGPEANHYMTVSHARNFTWRNGHMRDLIALLGDGLLTIDGEFHRRSRQIMLPAFHRERIAASIDVMLSEADRALDGWQPGTHLDLYFWTRRVALRIAMRALFGVDPDGERARRLDAAALFEQALGYYSRDYFMQVLRGPLTPYAGMRRARRRLDWLILSEIARRRASGERGEDVLSLLLDARDEQGSGLSDDHIRDEVMTLMFAGHDTTTSTVAFMFHELAHHPEVVARLVAEQRTELAGRAPTARQLMGGELPELEQVLDETLRMYPPAWVGPRHSVEPFEFGGTRVPGGAYVDYCSWASHHLPDVFADPHEFRPERFAPEAKAALPKGAYIPFGGGSRTCIGMRFGQLEVRAIATQILSRFTLELPDDFSLTVRQMPTIGPKGGLPVIVRERDRPRRAGLAAAA
jgi:cytochrome P450